MLYLLGRLESWRRLALFLHRSVKFMTPQNFVGTYMLMHHGPKLRSRSASALEVRQPCNLPSNPSAAEPNGDMFL